MPLLAQTTNFSNSSGWLLLGMSVLAIIYLMLRPRKKDPLATQPFRSSLAQQKALERDMQNVIVELSEMTRQLSAQLETRAARLEALLREADVKLAALREQSASIGKDEAGGESPASATRPPIRLADDVDRHSEERWAEVYRLADEGLTLPQIAQQLHRPTGEVELILALRPKHPAPQGIARTS